MITRTSNEEEQNKVNKKLLKAAFKMDTEKVKEAIKDGADVNYPHPETSITAFQVAASCADWPSLKVMLKTDKCDLLHRSENGWLTSTWAGMYGFHNSANEIRELEREQGAKVGIVPLMKGDVPIDEYNRRNEKRIKRFGRGPTENENDSTLDIEPGD